MIQFKCLVKGHKVHKTYKYNLKSHRTSTEHRCLVCKCPLMLDPKSKRYLTTFEWAHRRILKDG